MLDRQANHFTIEQGNIYMPRKKIQHRPSKIDQYWTCRLKQKLEVAFQIIKNTDHEELRLRLSVVYLIPIRKTEYIGSRFLV